MLRWYARHRILRTLHGCALNYPALEHAVLRGWFPRLMLSPRTVFVEAEWLRLQGHVAVRWSAGQRMWELCG